MAAGKRRDWLLAGGLVLALLAAYANHFQNNFHFDDSHTLYYNGAVQHLENIPRFFVDADLSSTLASNRAYRPVTSASLAMDYWLGHGLDPFYFHLSTFLWFAVQLILMFFLFRRIMDQADPHPSNQWTALAAAACYGLHPANAETVNYIVQRADLYSTLGVVASLLWFACDARGRKRGWYLLPAVAGFLSKPPALIFPVILLAYVWLFEEGRSLTVAARKAVAARKTLPAFVVTAAAAVLISTMTPASFVTGAASPALYRLTQPWVALHYFKCFFLPTDLSADSDWTTVASPFSGEALAGYLFVLVMLAAAWRTSRERTTRPIAFGILWFFLAMLPVSLTPLGDVTNDHRMFFPFVGLVLAVFWSVRLLVFRKAPGLVKTPRWIAAAMLAVLAAEAAGTHQRNSVWRTEESLWLDVTRKSPNNGRGLKTYGNLLLRGGDYAGSIPYLERAQALLPGDPSIEINLGAAYGGTQNDPAAERNFRQAVAMAPGTAETHVYYGSWLKTKGRLEEAREQLEAAVALYTSIRQADNSLRDQLFFPPRYLLMDVYAAEGNRQAFDRLARETLELAANDETARRYVEERVKAEGGKPAADSPEALLNVSAKYCNEGKYEECVAAARKALELRPGFAQAYNNMAAAYNSTGRWDEAIQAASEAVRLKPDYEMAKKNLQWALAHKGK